MDAGANGCAQVTPPLGTKPVGHLPKDGAHAEGLLTVVIRRWDGDIVQKEEPVLLDFGLAFLQTSAMGVGRVECQTAGNPPL